MPLRRTPERSAGDSRTAGRERRHQRILAAAEALFAAQGFAKTTVDEIAAEAGVSKGLVYAHYASKEELLDAVWRRLVDAWVASTRESVKTDGSIADALGEWLAVSIRQVRANPLLRRILAQDPGSLVPHGREGIAAFGRQYREQLEAVLARGRRNGELRRELDVAHTAETIWLIHMMLVRELLVGPDRGWRDDGDALLRSAVDLLVAGLRGDAVPRRTK